MFFLNRYRTQTEVIAKVTIFITMLLFAIGLATLFFNTYIKTYEKMEIFIASVFVIGLLTILYADFMVKRLNIIQDLMNDFSKEKQINVTHLLSLAPNQQNDLNREYTAMLENILGTFPDEAEIKRSNYTTRLKYTAIRKDLEFLADTDKNVD